MGSTKDHGRVARARLEGRTVRPQWETTLRLNPLPEIMWPMFTLAFRYALSDGIPRRSLIVALVVGTILNLINQGDALFEGADINWIKFALTYCVPYAVSTYGAVSYRLAKTPR